MEVLFYYFNEKIIFLVAIAMGFGISFVLWPNGFIYHPAYGAPTIGIDDLEDGAVTTEKIKDGEVKTQDLANGAVAKDKISPFALKLVTVQKLVNFDVPRKSIGVGTAKCDKGHVLTGGA